MLEVELKFGLSAPFDPSAFLQVENAGIARVVELPSLDLRASYYDTDDLRLARNGVTLRYRTGEGEDEESGWSVKLPQGNQDGAAVREELHFAGVPGRIPRPAANMVTAFARAAPLKPAAKLVTRRRRWSLRAAEDRELAALTDDEVSVVENRRVVARFRELEVEAREGDRVELKKIGRALKAAGAIPAEPISKAVRALGPAATGPGDVPPHQDVSPGDPCSRAIAEMVAAAFRRIAANDPIARQGDDPEGVHQMRVAARRLRSDLRTFAPLVDEQWAQGLIEELRWLAGVLGDVRDADVLQDQIHTIAGDLEEALQPFFASLSEQSATARQELQRALTSRRYKTLLERLVEACSKPGVTAAADLPCRAALPPLVGQRWQKLRKNARKVGADASDEQLHKVRIRAKRVRYAAEAAAPFLDKPLDNNAIKFAKRAAKLQDVLGLHQDAVMASRRITSVAEANSSNVAFNLAAGRVLERHAKIARKTRGRYKRVWKKLNDRKVSGWLKAYNKT